MKKYKIIILLFIIINIILIKTNLLKNLIDNISNKTLTNTTSVTNQKNNIKPMYFVDSITITSDVYDLNSPYLYVKDDDNNTIINNIKVDYGTIIIEDDKLKVKAGATIFKEYLLLRYSFKDIEVNNNKIILNKTYTYLDLKDNIKLTNLEYKIFDNTTEITSGNILNNMTLKLYYNGLYIDTLKILSINLDNIKIVDDKYIIENFITVKEFKEKINTNTIISDNNNNILNDLDNITTSSRITINDKEYIFAILGDITSTGNTNEEDITTLYKYYKNSITLDKEYILSGDVTHDGKIEINDIAKLYQYQKKVIDSLN